MPDVNEKIVQLYFELMGYMVTSNLKYMVKKKSSGESDIDLAIFKANPLDRAIVEVKGWHTDSFTMSYFKKSKNPTDYRNRLLNFVKPEALKEAEKFFQSKHFRRILSSLKLLFITSKYNRLGKFELYIDVVVSGYFGYFC